ncbi:hypothetical protein ALC56_03638, partial [Trachymyrmex septentrionalis]
EKLQKTSFRTIDSKLSRVRSTWSKEVTVTGECAEFESNLQMEGRVKVDNGISFRLSSECRSEDHKSGEELSPRNITGMGQADFQ